MENKIWSLAKTQIIAFIVVTVISGLIFEVSNNVGNYWISFAIPFILGMFGVIGIVWIIKRIFTIDYQTWDKQYWNVIVFFMFILSLVIGYGIHTTSVMKVISQRENYYKVGDTFGFLFFISVVVAVVYTLYQILSALLSRKKTFSDRLNQYFLYAKLTVAGIVVFFLTLLIKESQFNYEAQSIYSMSKGEWRSSSIVKAIKLDGTNGLSHRSYLKIVREVCKDLHECGVKVILVPLPPNLEKSDQTLKLINEIAKIGDVVFAVPPENPKLHFLDPDFLVSPPENTLVKENWGVISATTRSILFKYNLDLYFPFSYKENNDRHNGRYIPDAAVVTVRHFWNDTNKSNMSINGNTFKLGDYRTGLKKDRSSLIRYKISWSDLNLLGYSVESDQSDTLYRIVPSGWEPTSLCQPSDSLRRACQGKIFVIDPGYTITTLSSFGNVYTNIIDQILRKEEIIDLDAWSSVIIVLTLLITFCLLKFLKPWQSIPIIPVFSLGQIFVYNWLFQKFDVIIDVVPPVIAPVVGLFIFSFVMMADERKKNEQKEKKRMTEELQTAHDMQMGLMPTNDPEVKGFEISGGCTPSYEVGGDYYDYIWLDEEKTKFGIALADVSGKAMKAAMTAIMTSGMIYREVNASESPKVILKRINKPLYLKTSKHIFTAMSFAVIDTKTKQLTFSNAGQMPPILKRGNEVQLLKVTGNRLPLGVMEDMQYDELTEQLRPNDILFFYTDGIPEAMNEQKELFGFERLEKFVKELSESVTAKEIINNLLTEVQKHAGTARQHDDMTVVIVKVGTS